ncbi:H-NS histone family protein [Burkholderia thailandensis]|uniref:H-NS histone family protein n=1 Tax=Burkholderia thailandensis TaxID=57975 RepID=UPI002D783622|nr:H-NS histone family protein [Burkholderia thailandensis]WRS70009.1 H-NS histone family protein [Burkholderia thailandensis]
MRIEELLAERARLDKEIEVARSIERRDALRQIRYLMALYQIGVEELSDRLVSGKRAPTRVAPKYWNPKTGQTWSGRGRMPLWLIGQDLAAFKLDTVTVGADAEPRLPGTE